MSQSVSPMRDEDERSEVPKIIHGNIISLHWIQCKLNDLLWIKTLKIIDSLIKKKYTEKCPFHRLCRRVKKWNWQNFLLYIFISLDVRSHLWRSERSGLGTGHSCFTYLMWMDKTNWGRGQLVGRQKTRKELWFPRHTPIIHLWAVGQNSGVVSSYHTRGICE